MTSRPPTCCSQKSPTIWKKVRSGELTEYDGRSLVTDIESIAVSTVPCKELVGDAFALAVRTGRTVYDSMYVVLAIRLDTRLITADKKLANAAAAIPMIAKHVRFIADLTPPAPR